MNYPNIPEYRFDLSGVHPDNLIPKELIIRENSERTMMLVPRHAPFYIDTMALTLPTGEPMVYGRDYEFFGIMKDLSTYTGKAVGSFIHIINKNIVSFTAGYQTVGSLPLFDQSLADLFDQSNNDTRSVWWDEIKNRPVLFDPAYHRHDLGANVYAFKGIADICKTIIDNIISPPTYDPVDSRREILGASGGELLAAQYQNADWFMGVNSDGYQKTPAPHMPVFRQRLANGGAFFIKRATDALNALNDHIANNLNAHGVDKTDINLEKRDNFPVLTQKDALSGPRINNKNLATPAWFSGLIAAAKGDTSQYIQPGKLPICRYGDNTYLPPVIDANMNGIGTMWSWGVGCLERGGWVSAIANFYDYNTDKLMYLKKMDAYGSNNVINKYGSPWITTKKEYAPPKAVADKVTLNMVIKGGDWRWMIVGDSKANKWYLVRCNGTLEAVKHTLYPISFPFTVDKTTIEMLHMAVCGDEIWLFKQNSTNQFFQHNVASIKTASLSETTVNPVTYVNMVTTDADGRVTVSNVGDWSPFTLTRNAAGKITSWFTSFPTPLDNAYKHRGHFILMFKDSDGRRYLRIWWSATLAYGAGVPTFIICQTWYLNDGVSSNAFRTDIQRGGPGVPFDASTWDFGLPETDPGHLNEPRSAAFVNTYCDPIPVAGINPGRQGGTNMLSNGAFFALGSQHWNFYPLINQITSPTVIDLKDATSFINSKVKADDPSFVQVPVNNTSPSGVSSAIAVRSVEYVTDAAGASVPYVLVRSEVSNSKFQTLARKWTDNLTVNDTAPDGKAITRAAFTTDIRDTNLPGGVPRISWVNQVALKSANFFSMAGANLETVSGIKGYAMSFAVTAKTDDVNNTILFTETRRVRFTEALIKQLGARFHPNAVVSTAGAYQANWNILWFPGQENILRPVLVMSWRGDVGDDRMYYGIATLNYAKDPNLLANYSTAEDGNLECVMDVGTLTINTFKTGTYYGVTPQTQKDWWMPDAPAHIQPGHAWVYLNSNNELTLYINSSIYFATSKPFRAGAALVPNLTVQLTNATTIGNVRAGTSEWDITTNVPSVVMSRGFFTNWVDTPADLLGGSVLIGQSAGTTYASLVSGMANRANTTGNYAVIDVVQTSSWQVFIMNTQPVIMDGRQYPMSPTVLKLTSVLSNPANTTFYLYLEMVKGKPEFNIRTTPISDTTRKVFLGTIITDSSKITAINTTPVFTMQGFRVNVNQRGESIPASTGSVNSTGNFNWVPTS